MGMHSAEIGTFLSCVYCIFTLVQVVPLWLLCKCKRIPFKIKCTNISFLTSDLIISLIIATNQIVMAFSSSIYVHAIRTTMIRTCTTVYWATLTHIAADRAVSVISPLRYNYLLTNKHVKIWTLLNWIIPIIITCLSWIYIVINGEHSCESNTNFLFCAYAVQLSQLILSVIFCLMFILAQVSTVVLLHLNRNERHRQSGKLISRFTQVVLKLSILNFSFHLPFFIYEFLSLTDSIGSVETKWRRIIQSFGLLCHTTCSILTFRFCI
jgi:hypothetical protein